MMGRASTRTRWRRSPGDARGLGLLGMRERIELFGGSVTFDSTPGSGTRVVIEVPLHALFSEP